MAAKTHELRIIGLAVTASLKCPANPGLIEVLASLLSTGRFAPDDWDRAAEWIARAGAGGGSWARDRPTAGTGGGTAPA